MTPLINLPYNCVFDQTILRVISKTSILDPGCLSILDPDLYPSGSRIQKQQQKRGGKNLLSYLLCNHKFHKIENYFILKCRRKKFGPVFKELYNFLPKNLSLSSRENMSLKSGIRNTEQNYHFLNVYSLAYLFL